jgi:uncharacterized protein (DUF486 family)
MWSNTTLALSLLVASNLFMTVAWYGHLRFGHLGLRTATLVSWGIALFEYCLQVPANRIGYRSLSAYQLKIAQESISLVVFMVFAAWVLGETPTWRYGLSLLLLFCAVAVAFYSPAPNR